MSDAVSFAETDEQRVQLLPERTVMSMFFLADPGNAGNAGNAGNGPSSIDAAVLSAIGIPTAGPACAGGESGATNPSAGS